MANPGSINVDVADTLRPCFMYVRATGVTRMRVRLWLGAKLMRCAAWVCGFQGAEITIEKPPEP